LSADIDLWQQQPVGEVVSAQVPLRL
jgi:hypothetical protein